MARFRVLRVKVILRTHTATRVARNDVNLVRHDPWCPNRDTKYSQNSCRHHVGVNQHNTWGRKGVSTKIKI